MLFRSALDRSSRGAAHRSVKSYNNHVGVPLSLSRMSARAKFGVFEMGMNHAGEIAALTAQVRPHIAVITTIAPAHIVAKPSMLGWFVGQVMKSTGGKANPQAVNDLLRQKLGIN